MAIDFPTLPVRKLRLILNWKPKPGADINSSLLGTTRKPSK